MGSGLKQTRQLQKERFQRLLNERKAALLQQGIEPQQLNKDNVLKHLQAEIKRTAKALASISKREQLFEKLKQREKVAATEPETPKAKKKKAAAPQTAEQKKPKKEKKKQDT